MTQSAPSATTDGALEVEVVLYQGGVGTVAPAIVHQAAEVLLRDTKGRVVSRGLTNDQGRILLPLHSHRLEYGDQLEAKLDLGQGYSIGAVVAIRPGISKYRLAIASPASFFPEPGVWISEQ
jgi:hypothetical protein